MDEEDLLAVTLGGPTSVNAQSSSTFDPNDPYGEFGSGPVNDLNANTGSALGGLLSAIGNTALQNEANTASKRK
jgi:hypothetical protein